MKHLKRNILTSLIFLASFLFTACGSKSTPEEDVTISEEELNHATDELDALASANMELRKNMYRILLEMSSITNEAMILERDRETNGTVRDQTTMQRLNKRMNILRQQLEEAKRQAGDNQQLHHTIHLLERSMAQKQQEIHRLNTVLQQKNNDLREAYSALEDRNASLQESHRELQKRSQELRSTNQQLKEEEANSWIQAGDVLVLAAQMLPRPNTGIFSGEQSVKVKVSKLKILRKATECYNEATRMGNRQAESKAWNADALFNRVQADQSIGEE